MTVIDKNTLKDSFLGHLGNIPGSHPFTSLKNSAIQILQDQGLPARKDEEYKYTQISKKLESSLTDYRTAKPVALTKERVEEELIPGMEADVIVFDNGNFEPALSQWDPEDFDISLLSEQGGVALEKGFGKIATSEKDPFNALNAAMFEDGIYIDIPDGKNSHKPLLILSFNQANEGQSIFSRVFINVGNNAEITLIEKIISLDEEVYFLNDVTEISVADNSHLYYYKLQNESRQAIEVSNFETDIHKNGTFSSGVISLQGGMIRNNLTLNLLDSGCEGNMYGLYLLNGKTHVDNHTNVDHIKPHSFSNELYKGILTDSSRGVFNGKIFVRKDAQKTNAFQQNSNILLSEDAIINTKPQLEIWADDVKCTHGCTAGQLDEEALFYLRSRGIGNEAARGLLLYAFAGEVLEKIKNEAFRDYCIELIQERLGSNH